MLGIHGILSPVKFSLIISDRDLKEAQPSKATTLDIYELYHLLDKVKTIISRNLFTTFNLQNMISKSAESILDFQIYNRYQHQGLKIEIDGITVVNALKPY
jgi:hypothetical protein